MTRPQVLHDDVGGTVGKVATLEDAHQPRMTHDIDGQGLVKKRFSISGFWLWVAKSTLIAARLRILLVHRFVHLAHPTGPIRRTTL